MKSLFVAVVLLGAAALAAAAPINTFDFDGNGSSDVVWLNARTRHVRSWNWFNSPIGAPHQVVTGFSIPVDSRTWRFAGHDDFNSDGRDDIVFYDRVSRLIAVWFVSSTGQTVINSAILGSLPDANWRVARVGDLDGDDDGDLFLYNDVTGQTAAWIMDGTAVESMTSLVTVDSPAWKPAELADFDLDGDEDVLWENIDSGQVAIWEVDGNAIVGGHLLPTLDTPRWRVVAVSDFSAGTPDIVWQHLDTGHFAIWEMNGFTPATAALLSIPPGQNLSVVGVGDYDADGDPDLLAEQHSSTPNPLVLEMNGPVFENHFFAFSGNTTAIPPGGYSFALGESPLIEMPSPFQPEFGYEINQDGRRDLLWLNRTDGRIARWLMQGTAAPQTAMLQTLGAGWEGVASADMDHDGFADVVANHVSNQAVAIFYLDRNGNIRGQRNITFLFGMRLMQTGDLNGDTYPDLVFQDLNPTVDPHEVRIVHLFQGRVVGTGARQPGINQKVVDIADFDDDRLDDVLLYNDQNREVRVMVSSQTSILLGTTSSTSWRPAGAADFNNDGHTDIFFQHLGLGETAIWFMNNTTRTSDPLLLTTESTEWRVNGFGDYDADGLIDIAWKHRQTGGVAVWFMAGGAAIREGALLGSLPGPNGTGWVGAGASVHVEP